MEAPRCPRTRKPRITDVEVEALVMVEALMRLRLSEYEAKSAEYAAYWGDDREKRFRELRLTAETLEDVAKRVRRRADQIRYRPCPATTISGACAKLNSPPRVRSARSVADPTGTQRAPCSPRAAAANRQRAEAALRSAR